MAIIPVAIIHPAAPRMTPEQKLRAAAQLYWGARALKEAFYRQQHPDWSEERIKRTVKEWMMYARS